MVNLKKRILEIAYKHKLGHLGSYLSAAEIVDEIYKRLKDNKAKGLNGLTEATVKGLIMEQDQSYRYSKVSGLRLIDFLKNNSRKTKVVEALFHYASSESDDSGVYLKMQ